MFATIKRLISGKPAVGNITLSLDDVDKLDEAIEDAAYQFYDTIGGLTIKPSSILEYSGDNPYLNDLKALSLRINALREPLLFEE